MSNDNPDKGPYADIMDLPHPVSSRHPHMSLHDRAAQFAPFAALTGYGDAINETARHTAVKRALSESERDSLDKRLAILSHYINIKPEITVIYFVPDLLKDGGSYEQYSGCLKKIHEFRKTLIFDDGTEIEADEILSLDSELFNQSEFL